MIQKFMLLNEYRTQNKLSFQKLATICGAGHATVARRWCLPTNHKDRMIPNKKFMQIIQNVTMGAVQPNDFYRDTI